MRPRVAVDDSGTYLLLLHFRGPCVVRAGALGPVRLGPLAAYAGSAKVALSKRVARHLRRDKNIRWHIDYAALAADRIDAIPRPGRYDECRLAQALARLPGAEVVVGFGNGDCAAGCGGHLVRLPRAQARVARALARKDCEHVPL